MNKWYEKVMALGNNNFRSVIKTFKNHAPTILNFELTPENVTADGVNFILSYLLFIALSLRTLSPVSVIR